MKKMLSLWLILSSVVSGIAVASSACYPDFSGRMEAKHATHDDSVQGGLSRIDARSTMTEAKSPIQKCMDDFLLDTARYEAAPRSEPGEDGRPITITPLSGAEMSPAELKELRKDCETRVRRARGASLPRCSQPWGEGTPVYCQ